MGEESEVDVNGGQGVCGVKRRRSGDAPTGEVESVRGSGRGSLPTTDEEKIQSRIFRDECLHGY